MRYTPLLLCVFVICSIRQLSAQASQKIGIGFYNAENYFDTILNNNKTDIEFTPQGERHYGKEIFQDKTYHLAQVIATMNNSIPLAVIGIAEVEGEAISALIHHPLLSSYHYECICYQGNDIRGITTALLYQPRSFIIEKSMSIPMFIHVKKHKQQQGFFSRDILLVEGQLLGEKMYVLVNHWPSKLNGEAQSEIGRKQVAQRDQQIADSILHLHPSAKIILMGDLNEDPTNSAMKEILHVSPSLLHIKDNEWFNPWIPLFKRGIGSIANRDTWHLFDQIILNSNWVSSKGWKYKQASIFKQPFMIETEGSFKGYPKRSWNGILYHSGYSDHFPVYIILSRDELKNTK